MTSSLQESKTSQHATEPPRRPAMMGLSGFFETHVLLILLLIIALTFTVLHRQRIS